MQELNYQLVKEDYLDWIRWNVSRQNLKKVKIITAVVYVVFLVLYLGGSIASGKPPASLLGTLIIVLLLGVFMFYIVSAKHQERTIWKRSGLKRLEKTAGFPKVHLVIDEKCIAMDVPDQQVSKEYSYTDITQIEETERLFLLGTADKTWQFVAKAAFDSENEMREFKTFMDEKIEDAKENPEKYKKPVPAAEISSETVSDKGSEAGEEDTSWTPNEEKIEPVDTSSMGKIGKMAHIMAALAAKEAEGDKAVDAGEAAEAEKPAAAEEPVKAADVVKAEEPAAAEEPANAEESVKAAESSDTDKE